MAKKKEKKKEEGAPLWMLTYGDMMTLLLCFFIMLAAFSELKREEFQPVIDAFKERFGYEGGVGRVPVVDVPTLSVLERLEKVALHREEFRRASQVEDLGVEGRRITVKRIREGLQFTVGGLVTFEPGSADLKSSARADIQRIAEEIRGLNNKIEVRGHATASDLPPGASEQQAWELSFARARATAAFLTDREQGIRPGRVRVVACGSAEPLRERVYSPEKAGVNRRVEIIVTESLVQDFQAPSTTAAVSHVESE